MASKSGSDLTSSSGSLGLGSGRGPAGAQRQDSPMVDEMFDGMEVVDSVIPEDGAMSAGGAAASLLSELTSNDRTVHADFQNNFGDLFDDNDLS